MRTLTMSEQHRWVRSREDRSSIYMKICETASSNWMLVVAAVWPPLAALALVKGELLHAGLYTSFSVLAVDSYGRDKRRSDRSSGECEPPADELPKEGKPQDSLVPADPDAANEVSALARTYQGRGRASRAAELGAFITMALCFAGIGIAEAMHGKVFFSVLCGLIALAAIAELALTPAFRPRNVIRSLKAARRS